MLNLRILHVLAAMLLISTSMTLPAFGSDLESHGAIHPLVDVWEWLTSRFDIVSSEAPQECESSEATGSIQPNGKECPGSTAQGATGYIQPNGSTAVGHVQPTGRDAPSSTVTVTRKVSEPVER